MVSIIAFQRKEVMGKLIFNPYRVKHHDEWHRFITSGLIHANWPHLLINMFVFYQFGNAVEEYYNSLFPDKGWYYYLILYTGGIVVSILPTYSKHKDNPDYNALGASGAVSAIVFASILFQPVQSLCLYGILCLPGIVMGVAYLVYSYYMDKKSKDNINHGAHFWGAIFGVAFTLLLKPDIVEYFIEQIKNYKLFN